ncbi:MAG: sensor histidine kinase [Longimicrobiales bacterium]
MLSRRFLLRWGTPFLFWSVPAAVFTILPALEGERSLGSAFLASGSPWYFWAIVTPLIISLARRFPLESLRTARGLSLHLGSAILFGFTYCLLMSAGVILAGESEMGQRTFAQALSQYVVFGTLVGLILYTTVASVGFALGYQTRLRERELANSLLETRLVEAQLSALRMQLQPHFLFNSLNTVAMHVRDGDRNTSIRLLTRLSELLRHLLDAGNVQEVPLHTELEQVRRYLDIEGARFSDRLRFELNVPSDLDDAFVPNLLLQPLVENAIRHGLAARASAGLIELNALRRDGRVEITLRNEGPALPLNWSLQESTGIGLRNTALRLQHLYGSESRLEVVDWERGVRADITLPYRTRPVERPHG